MKYNKLLCSIKLTGPLLCDFRRKSNNIMRIEKKCLKLFYYKKQTPRHLDKEIKGIISNYKYSFLFTFFFYFCEW